MGVGVCRLCGETAPLQDSHFVPSFVFRWLKATSATGYIRFSPRPNVRAQDGPKSPMLCADCEARFNRWETEFANQVFYPMAQGKTDQCRYSDWMIKFCVSLSWRVLIWYSNNDWGGPIAPQFLERIKICEQIWREFLLAKRPNTGPYEQHFLPLGAIESTTYGNLPPNINRYLMRAVDIDIVDGGDTRFIYSKIGPFVVLGFVQMPTQIQWVGTKVEVEYGRIGPRDYTVPAPFGEFLAGKAIKMRESNEKLSPIQRQNIETAFRKDMDKAANSETFRAMTHDVRLFGRKAFRGK